MRSSGSNQTNADLSPMGVYKAKPGQTLARRHDPRKATLVDEAIGRQIRRRRRMLGMTQLELAQAIGIASQQIQKYEIGANRLSVSRLVEIAAALHVSVGWFFRMAIADRD
jgi:DNA-binding XRE family transcriptional regulator